MSVIKSAEMFCIAAHSALGQKRKYTKEPYYTHPMEVARILAPTLRGDEEYVIGMVAALLHDVVEDTQITLEEVDTFFGSDVAQLVEELTDVSKPEDGNREQRKEIDRGHTAQASPLGKSIKLADLIHNTPSILYHDPDFAKVYMREKRDLLKVLKEGDPVLYGQAKQLVDVYFANEEELLNV